MILKITVPDSWVSRWNAAVVAACPANATPEQIKARSDAELCEGLTLRLDRLERAATRKTAEAQAGEFAVAIEQEGGE